MTDQSGNVPNKSHDAKGRFTPDPDTAERDAQIVELFKQGMSHKEIASHLGCSQATTYLGFKRHLQAVRSAPGPAAFELMISRHEASLTRLDNLEAVVRDTLERSHITVSQGKAIYTDTGEPVEDDEFILKAVDRLDRIEARRLSVMAELSKLQGLYRPSKIEVGGSVTYEIIGLVQPEQ